MSTNAYSEAARVGRGAASEGDTTGGTACEASRWTSSSSAVCKAGGGVGGGARGGQGLPVVVSAGLQSGSLTRAWSYDAAEVSAAGGASNGPSSGSVSVSVAGQGLGSRGYSGAARVGRGAASEGDVTGGTACEASRWLSSSSAVCKVGGGVGGGARRGQGLPVVVSAGLQSGSLTQAWSYDAAEVSAAGGASNGPSSGCVSVTVAGQGLGSRGSSGAARVSVSEERGRSDGREGVRGELMVVCGKRTWQGGVSA